MKKINLRSCFFLLVLLFFTKSLNAQLELSTLNTSGCAGDPVFLNITNGVGPYQVDWGDGFLETIDTNTPQHFYNQEGIYVISVTDAANNSAEILMDVFSCFIDVFGNFEPCQGDCETYSIFGSSQGANWTIASPNGGFFEEGFGFEFTYCWEETGTYLITIFDDFGNTSERFVTVGSSLPIDIRTLSNTFCQADSLNPSDCEKICANSTAIYTVPNGQDVEWEVLGANSFTPNGNQVEVEWGAPGNGLVTATAVQGGTSDLAVNCNSEIVQGANGFTLDLFSGVTGGNPPYAYVWTNPNGDVVSTVPNVSELPLVGGAYEIEVTDGEGNSGFCTTYLVADSIGQGCLFTYALMTENESECDMCDGSATASFSSPFSNQAIFQWSTGETTSTISGLCIGTYTVTVTDGSSGCTGTASTTITCNLNATCPATSTLCVDILEDPEAKFSTIPAAVNGVVNICEGGTVIFNNESEGASLFEWNFGNENVATSINAEQTYPTAGTYQAYLISRNDCYCADTTFITIEVEDAISPMIDCVGTICENTTATYSTSANCGTFNWTISGDYTIEDGGGTADNFITIEWLTGPEGIVELEVASCSGGSFCLEPSVEIVPIISDNAIIKGPEKVCRLDEATYSINDYSASDFIWTVSNGGQILEGQNTSSIKVRWDGPVSPNAQQFVSVEYDNCYLGCGGSATKDVYILPQFYLEGDIEVCENGMSTHFAKKDIAGPNAVTSDWTVTASNGTVVFTSVTPTDEINLDWNAFAIGAGRYAIKAIPTDPLEVCGNEFTSYISLVEAPPAPTSIVGAAQICPGGFYTYEVNSTQPNNIFDWTINDGGTITTQTGNAINVSFGNTPPYILTVTQTSTDGLACESAPTSLEVFPLPNFTVSGDGNICEETTGVYTADFFAGENYEWTVIPAESGTIISGQNSNSVEIFWHEDGNKNVQVIMCNATETMPVTVIAKPEPVVVGDLFVCPGETTTIGTVDTYATYLWRNESGTTVSTTATADLSAGAYELIVTNSFGCENNVSFEVVGFPPPIVTVSVPGSWGRCFTGPDPDDIVTIHATEVPAGYTYEWFFNNNTIAFSDTSVIRTTDFGNYRVAVIDENGCTTFSNTVTIFELCDDHGVCNNPSLPAGCDQGTDVQMDFMGTSNCAIYSFQNISPNFVAGTVNWDFGDVASSSNSSTFDNPTHQFSDVGYYIVTLTALTPAGALCWDSKQVTVPLAPNFNFTTTCANEVMNFEDLTGVLPDETVESWSWNFGDPTSGGNNISNDQNPSHTYAEPGNYIVRLRVTHDSGCFSFITKTVTVEGPPTITFDEPTLNCQGGALPFMAQASADVVSYAWDFGDAASGAANTSTISNPFHTYANSGNFTVTCTATNIWGCVATETKTVTVEPNNLNGAITFSTPSPLCDGDVTTLTAPSGGVSWEWSDGSTAETLTTGNAGAYQVTITNALGCQYISPEVILDIISLPTATIQAVEYDNFGNPINVFYDNYATCEGESVTLQVVENANYSFTWSDGTTGNLLEYSEDRGNILTAGTYVLNLDIVDVTSGCSNTVGPFTIVIHPTPTNVTIVSNPSGTVCENTLTTLSVDNPQPNLTYVWNTGEVANSIQASAGGKYFVRGVTNFGCSAESNEIEINVGPDIRKIPDGCLTRCKPDTICLPTINGVSSYQWYLDGTAIAGPSGTVGDLIALESGAYHVVMTDFNGCEVTSDILNLDLFDGFGTFDGQVYMDVNDNGIIDAGDTLVSGIDIILTDNGSPLDTVTSDSAGSYIFPTIIAADYNLQVDVNSLPPNVTAVYQSVDTTLFGCDDMEIVDWLLKVNCISSTANVDDVVCFGENYIFDGAIVPIATPTDFVYQDVQGCDSIITVTITELPDNNFTTNLMGCTGADVLYDGVNIPTGTTMEIPRVSPDGCNFLETVEVGEFPIQNSTLTLNTCFGENVMYDNVSLAANSTTPFTFIDQNGCDSTVMVSVTELPDYNDFVSLSACGGNDVVYNGTTLAAGSLTEFPMTSPEGCAYLITVEVVPLPASTTNINLEICTDEIAIYAGEELPVGSQAEFIFIDQAGCDSTVVVNVIAFPEIQFDLQTAEACWNSNDGAISILNPQGNGPFEYSLDGNTFQAEPIFENLFPMTYNIFVQDANGCMVEEEMSIVSIPQLQAEVLTPPLPCDGGKVNLQVQLLSGNFSNLAYEWSDGSTDSELVVDSAGTYQLTLSNDCESITQTFAVNYENNTNESPIYIPNAFSPNGDGYNDVFKVFPSSEVSIESFDYYIFDRWGNHLYDTHNVDEGWDGRINGKMFNPGVYVYYIRAEIMSCGRRVEFFKKGDVTITR